MPKFVAVVDLGSNTTRLNLYAVEDGQTPELIAEAKRKVRLSEDMGEGKVLINPAAMNRALEAMTDFAGICEITRNQRFWPSPPKRCAGPGTAPRWRR
jgi:exopolyphosphatase/pppGpp-phosphohydrolase